MPKEERHLCACGCGKVYVKDAPSREKAKKAKVKLESFSLFFPGEPKYWAKSCLAKGYEVRTLTIPLRPKNPEDWPTVDADIKRLSKEVTAAYNWGVTYMVRNDTPWSPDLQLRLDKYRKDVELWKQKKRKTKPEWPWPVPQVNLEAELKRIFPTVPGKIMCCVASGVASDYRAKRNSTHLTFDKSISDYRFPMPIPLHASIFDVEKGDHENDIPRVTIKLDPNTKGRTVLRVYGGSKWRGSVYHLRQILDGKYPGYRESKIILRKSSSYTHRHELEAKDDEGVKRSWRIHLCLTYYRPKQVSGIADDKDKQRYYTMVLSKDPDHLVSWIIGRGRSYRVSGRQLKLWQKAYEHSDKKAVYNDGKLDNLESTDVVEFDAVHKKDQIKGTGAKHVIERHKERLQALSDDRKSSLHQGRKRQRSHREGITKKFNNKMDTYRHDLVNTICRVAKRARIQEVHWRDDVASAFDDCGFSWFDFLFKLETDLASIGISFKKMSSKTMPKNADTEKDNS